MKILLYTQYFPPESNAPANRWAGFVKCLRDRGHKITVLTSFPNHPLGQIFDGYKNQWRLVEQNKGVKIIRSWTYVSSAKGFLPRIMNYLSFAFSSFFNSLSEKNNDLIIASMPPLTVGLVGKIISRRFKKPLIIDLRDLWPEAAQSTGYLKSSNVFHRFLYSISKRKAQSIYDYARVILINSPALKEELICSYGVSSDKIYFIPNGVDLDLFANNSVMAEKIIEEKYQLKNKFVVLYSGLVGFAQNVELIVRTANLAKENKDIVFLIVGTGPKLPEVKNMIELMELKNVVLTGFRPRQEIPIFIKKTDVCLVTYKNDVTFTKNIPSKIFDYLAGAKPIIINLEGAASEMILEAGAGLVVPPDDPWALYEVIMKLYRDAVLKDKLGFNGQTYALNHYDQKIIARKLEQILEEIVGRLNYKNL